MPTRNSEKNKEMPKELEKTISPVLVVNNSSLKPYVELFEYAPENIYQQPLGNLVGFFEIKEYSQDSAYIVNFLTSVLKKEYYLNPKRSVTESFDAALHKVNIALSELAKHGNIEWLGKLNAAICILEKNSMHFSVAGNAKLFLYRKQVLSDISEGLEADLINPHPLKTFVDVSSGYLEKDDRLLITSEDIFHVLSVNELRKNFQRLEGEKFVQFLKTALSNQIEMLPSMMIDFDEKTPLIEKKPANQKSTSRSAKNVFSQKAFANPSTAVLSNETPNEDQLEEGSGSESNYTDKKTGHIYIQGEAGETVEASQFAMFSEIAKEKIADSWYFLKNSTRRKFSIYKKQLSKKLAENKIKREQQQKEKVLEAERRREEQVLREIELAQEQELELQKQAEEKIQKEAQLQQEQALKQKLEAKTAKLAPVINLKKKAEATIIIPISKETKAETKQVELREEIEKTEEQPATTSTFKQQVKLVLEETLFVLQSLVAKIPTVIKKEKLSRLIPHFSIIRKLFASFSKKQKQFALVAIVAIFVVPFFIAKWLDRPKAPTIANLQVTQLSKTEVLAQDKNIKFSVEQKTLLSNADLIAVIVDSENKPFAITKDSIIAVSGQTKEYPLPTGSGSAIKTAYMKDLYLIFVLTDQGKVISFNSISLKYAENKIDLVGDSSTAFLGTYLTYLYVLDSTTNQIYRYPRAEGGFGAKTDWLKDSADFSNVSDLTIDDNIYALKNGQILKFFKNKTLPFSLEASNTPVELAKIYTTPELASIYVLDNENSRLVQYSKDGKIQAQFYDESIINGSSLAVDEKNKLAYITTSSGLISISLQ